jgi:pimeloyl-ACP methyl ester carboxylesterase
LKFTDVTVMGHSFGGTTALAAAFRRPELVTSMIGHEPVADWLPDDARRALFPVDVMEDCPIKYDGGTGGLAADVKPTAGTIKDFDVLLLFSGEWYDKQWGRSDIIHWMYTHGKMCRDCTAEFALIRDSAHNEFSDSCMMTPVWLGRVVGVTGKRNPQQTAEEISKRTLGFLDTARLQKKANERQL